jgi:hypothetical protein
MVDAPEVQQVESDAGGHEAVQPAGELGEEAGRQHRVVLQHDHVRLGPGLPGIAPAGQMVQGAADLTELQRPAPVLVIGLDLPGEQAYAGRVEARRGDLRGVERPAPG